MKKTPKKLVFELDAKQILLVLIGLLVVGFMVYEIGVVTGSRATRAEMLQARLKEDPRQKIKAPSLLKVDRPVDKKEQAPTIEGLLSKVDEEHKETGQGQGKEEVAPSVEKKPSTPEKVRSVEEKKIATPEKKSTPHKAESKPVKVREERFFVQVASFPKETDARKRGVELERKGYSVVIVKAEIPGKGTYHRVRLGPFASLAKAKSFALKFEKKEKVSTFIPID